MKRDNDLIRSMMFEAEAADDWRILETGANQVNPSPEENRRAYHAILLCEAGLFAQVGKDVYRLTNTGHDWISAVRDDTIWEKTKEAASQVSDATLQLMGSIATGYIKQELTKLGIPLG